MATISIDRWPANEAVAGNEDLLVEILSRLPTKPLLRCKFVSRLWLNLISSRRFSLLHSRRNPNPACSALFFHSFYPSSSSDSSSRFHFIRLSPTSSDSLPPSLSRIYSSWSSILQSCNGLLLCRSISRPEGSDYAYYVCNPTLNRIAEVVIPPNFGVEPVLGLNLAFDPLRSEDYRVICVRDVCADEDSHRIDVYSPSSGLWRRSIDVFISPFDLEFERGVYWNGSIHWLSHTEMTLFYDVEQECLKPLVLPPTLEGAYIERFRYFGESRGHLHLIELRTNCVPKFDVLELDGDNLCWSPKYKVDLDVLGCNFTEMFQDSKDRFGRYFRFYGFSILGVIRGEEEDDSVLVVSVPGKVLSYNFGSKTTEMIHYVVDQSDRWIPFRGYNAFQYIPSLCSI
ncbi:hypothetical protein Dimus_012381 [Dionaea muscipula]